MLCFNSHSVELVLFSIFIKIFFFQFTEYCAMCTPYGGDNINKEKEGERRIFLHRHERARIQRVIVYIRARVFDFFLFQFSLRSIQLSCMYVKKMKCKSNCHHLTNIICVPHINTRWLVPFKHVKYHMFHFTLFLEILFFSKIYL